MSQMPPPDAQGPSEEEVREYLTQMRGAPASQVVAEVLQGLLNAAQVKLGRNDARLLLDATAAVNDVIRPHLDQQLTSQVDQALSQLRLAQVEAEREVAQSGESEPNDLPSRPGGGAGGAPPSGGESAPPPSQPPSQPPPDSPVNKLWLPGR